MRHERIVVASFKDSLSVDWTVELDGLSLGELREKCGVDIVQDGLFAIEQTEETLTKVLLVLCRDQMTERNVDSKKFSKAVRSDSLTLALAAVERAATDFFPAKRWSEIQSRWEVKREHQNLYESIRAMMDLLDRPGVPSSLKEAVNVALNEKLQTTLSSSNAAENQSVSGQDATPLNAVSDSQESSESIRAA